MHNNKSICLFILVLFFSGSCKKDNRKAEAEKLITAWMGKEIKFPGDIPCYRLGKDTLCPSFADKAYKILLYTDSVGCTSCKLKLPSWESCMKEIDSLAPGKAIFLFYFRPKSERELMFLFKRDQFEYPVFIDKDDKLNKLNRFPSQPEYQCFLLDNTNKVVLVGNPTLNPKIWELYKQVITGGLQPEKLSVTSVYVEQPEKELAGLRKGQTSKTTFVLKNTGGYPLVITNVDASCGCTVPMWDKKPVKPGQQTEITLEITPDTDGYFRKQADVFCNTEKGILSLIVKGNVEN